MCRHENVSHRHPFTVHGINKGPNYYISKVCLFSCSVLIQRKRVPPDTNGWALYCQGPGRVLYVIGHWLPVLETCMFCLTPPGLDWDSLFGRKEIIAGVLNSFSPFLHVTANRKFISSSTHYTEWSPSITFINPLRHWAHLWSIDKPEFPRIRKRTRLKSPNPHEADEREREGYIGNVSSFFF